MPRIAGQWTSNKSSQSLGFNDLVRVYCLSAVNCVEELRRRGRLRNGNVMDYIKQYLTVECS